MPYQDTIFALSTPPGRSGVAVIRLSGPESKSALQKLGADSVIPRMAKLVRLCHPTQKNILDQSLVLYFAAPNSFTGEDVAELHIHGGRATRQAVLDALADISGLRPAQPGEFTRRAFDNGKMDLTEVEGLADLIDAETEAQRRQALMQMQGGLSALYNGWRADLIASLAHMEAYLDFPDEEIPQDVYAKLRQDVARIGEDIESHLNDGGRGEMLREGLYAAIIGPPNSGKSSLLNALSGRDAAIVSHQAGTTRDVIEIQMDLGGYKLILADTAGIRESNDAIEQEGIRRSRERANVSDLKLLLLDGSQMPGKEDLALCNHIDPKTIVIVNKSDADGFVNHLAAYQAAFPPGVSAESLSVKTGYNLVRLLDALADKAKEFMGLSDSPAISRLRHRQALMLAHQSITRFVVASQPELAAEELRQAVRSIGGITGAVDVEEILDVVFQSFCIGK